MIDKLTTTVMLMLVAVSSTVVVPRAGADASSAPVKAEQPANVVTPDIPTPTVA